ncbi:MAG TPA: hypothetical protein VME44_16360 [Streptosporangiaceae bacterium]|nr:hypothetical protein [Streptosporangiaceae bacterium]
MGLMDRVKAQAAQIAQQAQEAAQEGRARLDQAQAGRRGDALLRQLGAAVFAERTGRGTTDSQARIDQLINEISAYESQNGLDLTNPTQPGFPQPGFPPAGPGPFAGPQPGSAPSGGAGQVPGPASGSSPDSGGTSFPDPAATPPPGTGGMPSVDTTTSFFPAPDDDQPG